MSQTPPESEEPVKFHDLLAPSKVLSPKQLVGRIVETVPLAANLRCVQLMEER